VQDDAPLLVKGRVSHQEEEVKVLAEEVTPLAGAGKVLIKIPHGDASSPLVAELRSILVAHRGNTPVYLRFVELAKTIQTRPHLWVNLDDGLVAEVESLTGKGSVLTGI
ncbi:MAG: hypothetical protein M1598_08860, partial [Actinobacteria bacterium]|nr:hypothetical protein [Actinomycetota bacterium]